MSSLSSMQLAVSVAQRARDLARQEVAQAQHLLRLAQEQLTQLDTYAQETQARWITQSVGQPTPELLRHYYQFMEKLQHALGLQQQVVQDAQARVSAKLAALTQSEFTLSSRETVVAQLQHEQRKRSAQREQKQLDELAAAQYRRNRSAHERGGEL